MKTEITHLERLRTMADHDRQCPACLWPLNVQSTGREDCPRCGHPTTEADNIRRSEASALRRDRGLIP